MKEYFSNIYKKYTEFDILGKLKDMSAKKRLIIAIIFFIVIFILNLIFNNSNNSDVNFRKLTSEQIIEDSFISTDRNIYWNMDNIIYTFCFTRAHSTNLGDERLSTEDFCNDAMLKEYKKTMSDKKMVEISNKIIDDVTLQENGEYSIPNQLIETVYNYEKIESAYLVKLKTLNNSNHYVGILIDEENSRFYIFYLE